MKTIEDYLKTLPEPYKSKAFYSAVKAGTDIKVEIENIQRAVRGSFIWGESPEGQNYWEDFYNTLK
jgi:hypothetical protein